MLNENEMAALANLRGSTAKLLLYLLACGEKRESTPGMMQGSGVADRKTFYAARQQLVELGWWENPPVVGGNSPGGEGFIPSRVKDFSPGVGNIPPGVWDFSPGVGDFSSWLGDRVFVPVTPEKQYTLYDGHPLAGKSEAEAEPPSLRATCVSADRMDGDGDPKVMSSNYQRKRLAQVAALQEAWQETFGDTLTGQKAKLYLSRTDECSEDVLDAMEQMKARGIQAPKAYIEKMLTPKSQAQAATLNVPGGRASSEQVRHVDTRGDDASTMMTHPSERHRKMMERAAKLGLDREDDGWDD